MPDEALSILYLTDRCDRGESAMIRGVHQHGMRVQAFANQASPHVQSLIAAGIPVTDIRWRKKLDREVLKRIRDTADRDRIDIIHACHNRSVLHMVLATRPLDRRGISPKLVAYLGVTGNVSWLSPLSWFRFLNPRVDRIICVAEAVRRYLLDDISLPGLQLDASKVVTIHKGHALNWYTAEPADLRQFSIPDSATVVTVAARLRRRKGLTQLIRAVGKVGPEREVHVLFLGHEGNRAMRAAAARLPHPVRVHFAGFRRDAPAIIAASDICCLPVLRGEGLSRAIIEGMAYGVTPLVTDVGGNAELVVDGECGLVVPPGNVDALARALEFLHDHPAQRRAMGAAARERIDRHFRSEDTVRKTLALYRELMK